MQKVASISIPDIIKRRYRKKFDRKPIDQQPKQLITSQDFDKSYVDSINEMIAKFNELDYKSQPQLSQIEKVNIVDFISQKTGISFNKHIMADSLNIKRIKNINKCYTVLERIGSKMKKSYFVLTGKIYIYKQQKKKVIKDVYSNGGGFMDIRRSNTSSSFWSSQQNYRTLQKFQQEHPQYALLQQIQNFAGFGQLFVSKHAENAENGKVFRNLTILVQDAVLITINNPQIQSSLLNIGGIDSQLKQQILNNFPVFNSVRKKMNMYLSSLEMKKFTKNQYIYKVNQKPQFLYLIIKGQVKFQTKISFFSKKRQVSTNRKFSKNDSKNDKKLSQRKTSLNSSPSNKNSMTQINVNTETISSGAYFGQEEIIQNINRKHNAKCESSTCYLLTLSKDKFEKLLQYSDFQELIRKSAKLKSQKRQQKLDVANQVHSHFQANDADKKENESGNIQDLDQIEHEVIFGQTKMNFNKNPNSISLKNNKKVKIMHGNLIRSFNDIKPGKQVSFSMLKANMDMYQSTMRKFRKWTMKPQQKVKPQVNWNLKRVWKVLNLDNILGQDNQVSSPQGLKFYETYRRYSNHVSQVKSLRPKTSSSSYRTKLQYIAYLQKFNHEKTLG